MKCLHLHSIICIYSRSIGAKCDTECDKCSYFFSVYDGKSWIKKNSVVPSKSIFSLSVSLYKQNNRKQNKMCANMWNSCEYWQERDGWRIEYRKVEIDGASNESAFINFYFVARVCVLSRSLWIFTCVLSCWLIKVKLIVIHISTHWACVSVRWLPLFTKII